MKRKTIALMLGLLTMASGGISTQGQTVGEWKLYSLFSGGVNKIVDAAQKVYYLSSNRLYSYDKTTSEAYSYTTENVLNDTNVSAIYYNADKGYLLVVYDTSNMDMIFDDGHVVNLNDISAANLTYTKGITDVAFGNDRIYVGTDFGLVVYNDETQTVEESGIYGKAIKKIAYSDNHIIALVYGSYYYASTNTRLNAFDKFRYLMAGTGTILEGTGDGMLEYDSTVGYLRSIHVDWDTAKSTIDELSTVKSVKDITRLADNKGYVTTSTAVVFVDLTTGAETSRTTLPTDLQSQTISLNKDMTSVWAGDDSGVANYNVTTNEVLVQKFKPDGALTCAQVAFIAGSADGSRVYLTNLGNTQFRSIGSLYDTTVGKATVQRTDVIVDGKVKDAALFNASTTSALTKSLQKTNKSTRMYGGPDQLVVDPEDPDRYFIANNTEGVYVVKNNEEVAKFNQSNMPTRVVYSRNTGGWVNSVAFDPEGNLWVGHRIGTEDESADYAYSPYIMLPKEYVQGDLSKVTKDDWKITKHKGVTIANSGEARILICEKSPYIFTYDSDYEDELCVYIVKGKFSDVDNAECFILSNLKDAAGNAFKPVTWISAVEDKKGAVWFATTAGVAVIPNPKLVTDASYQITRPKVPRNDGTAYADYLLDAVQVNAIAVDATNRKWIGTETSGLYYVSEDGDEILAHYTTDNSPLPSNTIQSLYCDPNSNLVYIGLPSGLITYRSTAVAASEDYSNVYAYPNPVRPEYTGWITITGLMENSLVKIADAAGNVVFQTRSEGGMAVWDGCNAGGERVSTGVYFVFASQNENDNASSVVTKIMVVK